MRVADDILKCVCFVSKRDNHTDYRGTAFIVSVPYDGSSGCLHLVTAKHVAAVINQGDACIGINAKDGQPRWMVQGDTPWFYHPTDETVDVAVLPMASGMLQAYEFRSIPIDDFATHKIIEEERIGLGDELINVGLFQPFPGSSDLLEPIVRTGNIAMMPKSRVPNHTFGSVEAYLAEGRSMGGLSGSPVFVRSTVNMDGLNHLGQPAKMSGLGGMRFFGLIHGHWDAKPDINADSLRGVNMGISIIVPAHKILEVLFSPALCAARDEAFQRFAPGFEQ